MPSITEVQGWSVDQVIGHLQTVFPDLSRTISLVFRRQQINGDAFLTLAKEDFVGAGIAIGPAANIANHIQKLKGTYLFKGACFLRLRHVFFILILFATLTKLQFFPFSTKVALLEKLISSRSSHHLWDTLP
jgi:hypothetical protein